MLLLVLWGGFAVHQAPRFAGTLAGGVLGVAGAILMVVFSLAYSAVKRIPKLKQKLSQRVSMGDLLKWHVYTGALGATLAILHTGHRFESTLGIALTAMVLLATLSGYVGRHLLVKVSMDLREKQTQLTKLVTAYNDAVAESRRNPDPLITIAASGKILSLLRLRSVSNASPDPEDPPHRAVRLAQSVAELEYSIRSHERFKRLASIWLKAHIATALAFYVLLGLHVWAGIHFGLRWFE